MNADELSLPFTTSTMGTAVGEPAIVLPGGPCRGPEYLGDLAGLASDHPLVVMHPRGTPASGGLSRGWWADAEDVVALIDALGLRAVDLIAHSAGTRLALATAARFPERVRSIALITPPATWLSGTPSDVDSLAVARTEPAATAALTSMADDPTTEQAFQESFYRQAPATYARWTGVEQAHARIGAVSLAATAAWFTDIPPDAVARIRAATLPPTLVVGGDRDLLTGAQPVRDYAALLGAELSMISDCGHYPWVEHPAAFRAILHTWLARTA